MKVAVLFSGQLRGDYHRTIKQIRSVMPDDFDFFFGTWSDQNEEKVNQPFIDKVYDYPELDITRRDILSIRQLKHTKNSKKLDLQTKLSMLDYLKKVNLLKK